MKEINFYADRIYYNHSYLNPKTITQQDRGISSYMRKTKRMFVLRLIFIKAL